MKNKTEELGVKNIEEARTETDKKRISETVGRLAEVVRCKKELKREIDESIASILWTTKEASDVICDLLRSENEAIRLQAAKAIIEISLANRSELFHERRGSL